ncbi:hypothetical protein ACH5RR_039164 [Cinchona calisaya]|uniref:Uncharacterized protein n=1 Tax=Cinchona calisaya TaxID=153742 RepID=A0ABD2XZ83_9GENT
MIRQSEQAKFFFECLKRSISFFMGNYSCEIWLNPSYLANDQPAKELIVTDKDLARIRELSKLSLMAKPVGCSFGFQYFDYKIRYIWKPKVNIEVSDLSYDFFITRFIEG